MNPPADPQLARRFALKIVTTLRGAGHQAYWAGGCVRDQLLGQEPKDYDVATAAHPDQIREIFGRRRTLMIGAAFGVVTVLGPPGAGQIEVATFRRDEGYSDGRHPDRIAFSTADEDAQRRDFTINGLFYDPELSETIDYVGGRDDLRDRVIRCIGDAHERFDEDKLRMLRAVRFATTLGFDVDRDTTRSIEQHADEISCVSPERIAAEMRRLMSHHDRHVGLDLLRSTGLWRVVLPEYAGLQEQAASTAWQQLQNVMAELATNDFATAMATCLWPIAQLASAKQVTTNLCQRWRLANDEQKQITWLLLHESEIRQSPQLPWPRLQRILIHPGIEKLIILSRAVALANNGEETAVDYAADKLQLAADELNPPPLINGHDLQSAGVPRGPQYRIILEAVRDAQLESRISTRDEAIAFAEEQWNQQLATDDTDQTER